MALTALVLQNDIGSIMRLLGDAGWLLFWLIPLRCLTLGLDVRGWQLLILERTEFYSLFAIACVREAVNRLLPVMNVGGELIGVRLLVRRGVSFPAAVGGIIVEIALNLLAQVLFLALGVACLLHARRLEVTATTGAAIAVATAIALIVFRMRRSGTFFEVIAWLGARLIRSSPKYAAAIAVVAQIESTTRELASRHRRLSKSLAWQLCGLISGSAGTWSVLRWLGHLLGVEGAVASHFLYG